jgi:glyoxylase-like metal-dependent hydrolase (beta-lactamase superfamily II)
MKRYRKSRSGMMNRKIAGEAMPAGRKAAVQLFSCVLAAMLAAACGSVREDVSFVDIGGVTRAYLLPCSGGYLLVDTGYEKYHDDFMESIQKMGIRPSDIRYILLTHHHDDHSGFADRLLRETGATLIVHRKAYPFLAGGKPEMLMKPLNWCTRGAFVIFTTFIKEKKDHSFPPVPLRKGTVVISGDDAAFLPGIGINGAILETPGHSDDSLSVVLADGKAFVGDCAMDMLPACACRYRPIYANDMGQVYSSWRKIIRAGAQRIYSAHGPSFTTAELEKTMDEKKL